MTELKQSVNKVIDSNRERIIAIGEDILTHPELGYKETYASALVKREFEQIGLSDLSTAAMTGVKAVMHSVLPNQSQPPVRIAVIGELDAVISKSHPFANDVTGAAHACGHHAQIAAMIGCAIGLSAVREHLDGEIYFIAAPAEEYIELSYRDTLKKSGKIEYFGGKQQMIAEGLFDDIDLAVLVHSETNYADAHISINSYSSGFIGKTICFTGKEAHAGGAPWDGINALNAASLSIQAMNAWRETFKDSDGVRVHPIITKGGDLVNTVPGDVRMECFVRALSIEAMIAANNKVNRAIRGASYAMGTSVQITDTFGYLPMQQNPLLNDLFKDNAAALLPNAAISENLPFCGSTDMGDLSYLMPVIQPTISGFVGDLHSKDFMVQDPELAYIVPAKLMAMTVIDLLANKAEKGNYIKNNSHRRTKEEYIRLGNHTVV